MVYRPVRLLQVSRAFLADLQQSFGKSSSPRTRRIIRRFRRSVTVLGFILLIPSYSRPSMALERSSWFTRPTIVRTFFPSREKSMLVGRPRMPPNFSAMESLPSRMG